jgi:hypothetical protein
VYSLPLSVDYRRDRSCPSAIGRRLEIRRRGAFISGGDAMTFFLNPNSEGVGNMTGKHTT